MYWAKSFVLYCIVALMLHLILVKVLNKIFSWIKNKSFKLMITSLLFLQKNILAEYLHGDLLFCWSLMYSCTAPHRSKCLFT